MSLAEAPASEVTCGAPTSESSIRGEARRAFGWSLLNSVAGRFATVFVGLVLARLLVPDEYGTFAVALVVLAVLQSMNELGVSVAVVQWQGDVRRAAHTAVTLACGTSMMLYTGVFFAASWIAAAIGAPDADVVIGLAIGVLIDGVSSIPGALMAQAFQQRRRAVADLVALIPSSAVSLILAVHGFGAMSLAWGSLAGNLTATILVLILAPSRPLPGWRRSDAQRLLRTGLPLAGASLLLLATLNLDYVVVGRVLGTTSLGLYLLAFNLSSWPANILSIAVRRVAIPAFARLASRTDELERSFTDSLRMLALAGCFLAAPMVTLAAPLLGVVYGHRWVPAAGALAALAVLGGLRVAFDLGYDLLAAAGRSRTLLVVQAIWLASLLIALPIGASVGGIGGVAIAHVAVAVAVISPMYLVALASTGIASGRVLTSLTPAVLASGGFVAAVAVGRAIGIGEAMGFLGLWLLGVCGFIGVLSMHPYGRELVNAGVRRLA